MRSSADRNVLCTTESPSGHGHSQTGSIWACPIMCIRKSDWPKAGPSHERTQQNSADSRKAFLIATRILFAFIGVHSRPELLLIGDQRPPWPPATLKVELEAELHLPRIVALPDRDEPEVRAGRVVVRSAADHRVEYVERFKPEVRRHPLADDESLHHRHVKRGSPRIAQVRRSQRIRA